MKIFLWVDILSGLMCIQYRLMALQQTHPTEFSSVRMIIRFHYVLIIVIVGATNIPWELDEAVLR